MSGRGIPLGVGFGKNSRARRTAPVRPSPRAGHTLGFLVLPAFWLLAVLLGVGAVRIGTILHQGYREYPVAATTALVLFALYAVPFVIFVRAVDYLEREPPLLLATAFGWGGLVATSAALSGTPALHELLAKTVSPGFAASWGPALAGPTTEEILKLLGVVVIALVAGRQINSVLDGFVYGALVGLGFQVVENVVFALNAVDLAGGGDRAGPVVATFLMRGFLGGLWSHTLFTALAGAGIAYVVVRRSRSLLTRLGVAAGCFLGAWLCHFLWNSPLLGDGFGYGLPGVIAVLLVKGLPALAVILALIRSAERLEGDYYSAILRSLADPRIATDDEIEALASLRTRLAARRLARTTLGRRGARAVRRLQRAQAHLAVELSREPGSHVPRRQREVLVRRHQLMAVGLAEARSPHRHPAPGPWLALTIRLTGVILAAVAVGLAVRAVGGG